MPAVFRRRAGKGRGVGGNLDLPLEEGEVVRAIAEGFPDEVARGCCEKIPGFYTRQPTAELLQLGFVFLKLSKGEMAPAPLLGKLGVEIGALFEEFIILVLSLGAEAPDEVGSFCGGKGGMEKLGMAAPVSHLGF